MNDYTFNREVEELERERGFHSLKDTEYEYTYLEEELYCIRKTGSKMPMTLLRARSPYQAYETFQKMMNRVEVVVNQNASGAVNVASVKNLKIGL